MTALIELEDFAARLRDLSEPALFDSESVASIGRAPGRLDVMGGIADYSGSLVLELPIREAAFAAVQRASDGFVSIASLGASKPRVVRFPVQELVSGRAAAYASAREFFRRTTDDHWAAYLAGVLLVLRLERGLDLGKGVRIALSSEVPEGKGVSSSAAIEVATMSAVAAEFGLKLDRVELALLCQKVENLVVGAPCGVMDQMTSACGEEGKLLELLCQPAQILGQVSVPDGVRFFGIDSGLRHAVTGADYGQVRVGAFMGYRIIAEIAKFAVQPRGAGEPTRVHDPLYAGFLANVTPSLFQERYAAQLPESLSGREFLARYGATTDSVTHVDPDRSYPVRAATAHPIFEHHRVKAFAELLGGEVTTRSLELLGDSMYQSHASYGSCGLGSEGTDRLVALVRELGPKAGLFGAKITGGGSGGTVAVLARAGADAAIDAVARRYSEETGRPLYVFRGSSPGAVAFGACRLEPGRAPLRFEQS